MRLHSLTVTAFGPFAGTEHVDFDELNEAGLFLLTGPTGAGKSSLLDAVCFALYGTVPGVRGVKALKSQHAPAAQRPGVALDFSVQGRRFVVRRTPEWTRPKQRGSGVLTEKASASLMETTGGTAQLRSARAAEVGLLVSHLMGMSAGQFVQVALLPQGEFQTFLRASSQERHDVLQQLFRTDRFARIEDWVSEHSRRLKDQAETGRSTVQRILDTVADRVGTSPPDDLGGAGLAAAAADGRVRSWVSGVLADARTGAELAREEQRVAATALRRVRRRHQEAVHRAEQRLRRDAAQHALATLAASEPAACDARARLTRHERAVRCGPVLELHAQALTARADAAAARDRSVRALVAACPAGGFDVPDEVTSGSLSALLDTARHRTARLEALVPRERAAGEARRERDGDLVRLAVAEQDRHDAGVRAEQVPAEIEHVTAQLSAAAALAARQEGLASALRAARVRERAAMGLRGARRRLGELEDARLDARDRLQDAREVLQAVVGRRLAGMAAELAGALTDGTACQVCGSTEHPRRATPEADAVTDRDHAHADRSLAEAATALEAAEQAVRDARRRHDTLVGAGQGLTPERAAEEVARLEEELSEAVDAASLVEGLDDRLAALRSEQAALGRRQAAAAAASAGLRESVAAHERSLAAVTAEIEEALGDDGDATSASDAVRSLSGWCELLTRTRRAVVELEDAESRLESLTEQALAAAAAQHFARLAEVEDARLSASVRERLDRQLRERADAEARAHAVLDDPDLADLGVADPEDLTASAVALAEAEATDACTARTLAVHEDRVTAVTLLLDRLTSALTAWAPVRDESLRAEAISGLVRGMGRDNQLQMRLSAYVLATRLDQVVAAANERLGHMRDQRYLLQRTGRAERRTAQAGLGLEIVDQWTGDVRSPSTLSGGETFVVSLSLALGLADVVTHESGGTEVETLFVDEGFGTLDADTLDDVMDRLDGLRAGGRTVGVVSHVTELRSRIPTQVQVDKGRAGSTVSVRTLVR